MCINVGEAQGRGQEVRGSQLRWVERRGGGPQLVRAMVSITCSSLLRSLCRRANSSFCSADRICRGGNDLRLECFHGLVGSYLVGL